jgi:glycosyltransferase 2 family protein
LKNRRWILWLVGAVAIASLVVVARGRIHFEWGNFLQQLKLADWRDIGIGVGCIYLGYLLRSARWALLLRHNKKIPLLSLIGTQVIGFTAVALIGRVADLVRPYLVSKKTALPVSSQIAVYIVERLFDAGAMALIFSIGVLSIPQAEIVRATSQSGHFSSLALQSPELSAFIARYGGLVLTLLGALFLVAVRVSGNVVASFCERSFGLISKKLGQAIGDKIRTFHSGLDTIRSFSDFGAAASLSLVMWGLIALAYFEGCRAFTASPQLAAISFSKCVLLMIASGGASVIQLPVLGWFTQIGIVAAAISGVSGATAEAATACAATLLLVTFLAIVPVGLLWARFEGVSLKKVSEESEHAGEAALAVAEPTPEQVT